ncbi:unnamed protein product, partial [Symbiodinium sp. CCMP2456]
MSRCNSAGDAVSKLPGATLDSVLENSHASTLCLPWEQGVFADIFGDSSSSAVPSIPRHAEARESLQESSALPADEPASLLPSHPSAASCEQIFLKFAVRAVNRRSRLSDDDIFELHVQRFELVLAHAYEASILGRGFKDDILERRQHKVRLALGGKAPRTLQKRFGQAAKLLKWANSESLKGFPIDAQIVEEYLRFLCETTCKHSVLTGAIECFAFLHHVLGVDMDPGACKTPIVQGILRKARLERPEKHQARPLLVLEVLALEAALVDPTISAIDRFCIGAFLFALYGRARLGDLKILDCFLLDLLDDSGDSCGGFSNVSAETDSFAQWLQDILSALPGYSGERVTGHSAKATHLSWLGKAGTDLDTQTILGHHVLVGRNSALTYARDTQAAPVRQFEALLRDVRQGVFLPDATRSGRFVSQARVASTDHVSEPGAAVRALEGVQAVGEASVDNSDCMPSFSFPPSPPAVLPEQPDDAFFPSPCPHSEPLDTEEAAEAWLSERAWYAEAAPFSEDNLGEGPIEEPADCSGGESGSSSSDSSSEASIDEKVQASGDRAGELQPRKVNECLMYRRRNTRTVHLLPAGSSSGRFVCGREYSDSVFAPVCGDVHLRALECKQCYKGKPLRDIGALNHAL